jgi:transposase
VRGTRKNYTDEFRQRAVDLYESTPGATVKGIAANLGISRGALRECALKHGSGTMAAGTPSPPAAGRAESQAARIVRLEAELAASRVEQVKLETERDILRQAAKYFAGETNW